MADETKILQNNYQEKTAKAYSGYGFLFLTILLFLMGIAGIIFGAILLDGGTQTGIGVTLLVLGIIFTTVPCFLLSGFKVLNPNEALVLTLFGKYYGTLKKDGFYWTNPFCVCLNPGSERTVTASSGAGGSISVSGGNKKISLKTMTLNNEKQTVNDELGNPIIIGTIVIWRVVDTTKAVFNVANYKTFLSIQCDSATRHITRLYPYDVSDSNDEKTLRGSSQEIAEMMKKDLQARVDVAGLEILEVRITHLSYAPEIAAAMLQRQQAEAIVAARKKIVEGAVGMVQMALDQLNEGEIIQLDEERKAAMVSNLLVVLCGNRDAQPVVNSGSIY